MYYSSSQKEIVTKEPDSYSDFGAPYKAYPLISDPVDVCLPGSFLNPEKSSDLDLNSCPIYMSQRCSTLWDDKCSLYVNSLDDPMLLKNFLRATASKKFCHLTTDSTCKVLCQPFNPIAQDSPQICSNVGKDVLKNANDYIDIGYYIPVNMSPDYMSSSCSQTCDNISGSATDPSDVVITACLKYGFCNDILTGICQTSGGKSIAHPGLQQYCSSLSTKEGFSNRSVANRTMTPFKVTQQNKGLHPIVYFLIFSLICIISWMAFKKVR